MFDYENRVNHILIKNNRVYFAFDRNPYYVDICPISCFIGDRLADWEEYLINNPDIANNVEEIHEYDHYFRNNFNTYDFHWAFLALNRFLVASDYLNDKDSLWLLEKFRSENDIPLYCSSKEKEVFYYNCETMRGILFSIIHYYLMSGYKLTKCKHCGLLFATKTLKVEYCIRRSPCYKMIVCNEPILRAENKCEVAVRTITQKFRDRKKSIYNNWLYYSSYEKLNEFLNNYQKIIDEIKKNPCVENIVKMQEYLYSDNMPKKKR